MARNRVIYQSEALFVGGLSGVNTGSNGLPALTGNIGNSGLPYGIGLAAINQLQRVQSANYSFTVNRTDVNEFGQLAAIDRVILEQPTVSLDFTYYLNSGDNERFLGLVVNNTGTANLTGALGYIMQNTGDVKNYYILVTPEGTDVYNNPDITTTSNMIGIGNGFLASYNMEASVGSFPTITANVDAYNMRFYGFTSGEVPTISTVDGKNLSTADRFFRFSGELINATGVSGSLKGYSALKPGDISLNISGATGISSTDLKVQSASINLDIGREDLQKLGNRFPFTKLITFPLTATMTIDAVVGDLAAANLADLVNGDCGKFNLDLAINGAACGSTTSKQAIKYYFRGAKLDSEEFSSSVGSNKSVTLTFSSQIGGPTDQSNGVFIEGSVN